MELRPYQKDSVAALRHSYVTGHQAPILQLATGGGKTVPFHGRDWRDVATRCGQFRHLIDDWEEQFLEGLPRFSRLSGKQYNKLIAIVARLRACGCRI